jgi:hypothetical protein
MGKYLHDIIVHITSTNTRAFNNVKANVRSTAGRIILKYIIKEMTSELDSSGLGWGPAV